MKTDNKAEKKNLFDKLMVMHDELTRTISHSKDHKSEHFKAYCKYFLIGEHAKEIISIQKQLDEIS